MSGEVFDIFTRRPYSEERRDQVLSLELNEIEAQLPGALARLNAAVLEVEHLERRAEDIRRVQGTLGEERGLGDIS